MSFPGFTRAVFYFSLLAILFLSTQTVCAAGAGSLDTTFGTGGKVFTPFEGQHARPVDIARQPDGKIVVACGVGTISTYGLVCLVRYNPDGSLDTTFDGDGKVITNLPEGQNDFPAAIALQADGKIVVVGSIRNFTGEFFRFWGFFIRYNSDGSLDTSFDGDGVKFIDNLGNSTFTDVAIQPDGKIVGAGRGVIAAGTFGATVVRLYNDGTFDPSLSNDGVAGTPMPGYENFGVSAIALQSDGKILLSGTANSGTFYVLRYNADGSLDTGFDGDGIVFMPLGGQGTNASNTQLIVQPDGKILQIGSAATVVANRDDIVMIRYNPNGSIDTTFDGDSLVVTHVSADNQDDFGVDAYLQPDGKILVLANLNYPPSSPSPGALWGILRYNSNGSLDPTFGGGDGVATTTVTGSEDYAYSMLLQPDGKLLVAGRTGNPHVLALLRFNTKAQSPFDFDGDGKTDLSIYRPSAGQWWILKSGNGENNVFTFGVSTDRIVPGDYTGDGKTDVAVWRPSNGVWYILRSEDYSFYAFPFGLNGDIPAVGDFDGDGKADATIFRPSNGTWYIANSTGGYTVQTFGTAGDVPVPADYDGDGKADIAIYRPSQNQWWLNRSRDGVAVVHLPIGLTDERAVTGDFTGDGKADCAVYSPGLAAFRIQRSEDGSPTGIAIGDGDDIPVPGDYDGDGITDAAVFDAPTWRIRLSTTGKIITENYGFSTDKPVPSAFVP